MWNKLKILLPVLAVMLLLDGTVNAQTEAPQEKQKRAQKDYSPYPQPDAGYVTDKARLLTRQQQEKIEQMLWRTEEKTGIEVAVVTIDSIRDYPGTDNGSIEAFATGLFNKYGIGNMPANNGVLLVVAYKDRKARIELGKGYGHQRDAAMDRIMSTVIIPAFKRGDYDQGIIAGTDALVKEFTKAAPDHSWVPPEQRAGGQGAVNTAAPATATATPENAVQTTAKQDSGLSGMMANPTIWVALLIIFLVMIAFSLFRNGKTGWGWVVVGLIFVIVIGIASVLFSVLRTAFDNSDHGDSGGWGSGGFGGGFGGGSSGGGGSTGSW